MRKDIIGMCIIRNSIENSWGCGLTFGYVQNGKTVITGQVREGIDTDIVTRKKPCFTYTQLKDFIYRKYGAKLPNKKDLKAIPNVSYIEYYSTDGYRCIMV